MTACFEDGEPDVDEPVTDGRYSCSISATSFELRIGPQLYIRLFSPRVCLCLCDRGRGRGREVVHHPEHVVSICAIAGGMPRWPGPHAELRCRRRSMQACKYAGVAARAWCEDLEDPIPACAHYQIDRAWFCIATSRPAGLAKRWEMTRPDRSCMLNAAGNPEVSCSYPQGCRPVRARQGPGGEGFCAQDRPCRCLQCSDRHPGEFNFW